MNINELKSKSTQELVRIGGDLEVEGARELGKDILVERIGDLPSPIAVKDRLRAWVARHRSS